MNSFKVNQLAVIFTPSLDESGGQTTLVLNPKTGDRFVVNKLRYFILKVIDENPGINIEALSEKIKVKIYPDQISEDIKEILKFFLKENIISSNE